jgi:ABC-type phosphate/phosphonate transport system permease subunit
MTWANDPILQVLEGIGVAFVAIFFAIVVACLIALMERNPND